MNEPAGIQTAKFNRIQRPTTDACASVNDVGWIIREFTETDIWTATTYGRNLAVEVLFDPNQVASSAVLVDLGGAVSRVEQSEQCLGFKRHGGLAHGKLRSPSFGF
ncbi:hypothetical protein [Arthrobacter sp. 35/47]|uniref:hypothetical protein n=1 Tax=Arthrobacter sp. 35/47 TaxID=269454 RepID=UPI0004B0411A|nr:hypothetical protein [Arthrobacter sp. 35/47]